MSWGDEAVNCTDEDLQPAELGCCRWVKLFLSLFSWKSSILFFLILPYECLCLQQGGAGSEYPSESSWLFSRAAEQRVNWPCLIQSKSWMGPGLLLGLNHFLPCFSSSGIMFSLCTRGFTCVQCRC